LNSPLRADSNQNLPDSGGQLPIKVSPFISLLTSIAMHMLRNLHHSIPLNRRIPKHPVPMLADRWLKGYPCLCTTVPRTSTFKLLATEYYRHADASRPIPFNCPQPADPDETLPDPGGHLPAEVSPFLSLLTSIGMCTLRNIHHSISLNRRIPTHPVLILSDGWLKGYPYFGT